MKDDIRQAMETACSAIARLSLKEQVEALNQAREMLHGVSPFKAHPVDLVTWVPASSVHGNPWNPNTVAPPEFKSLRHSIRSDGYTQPIVTTPIGLELLDSLSAMQATEGPPDQEREARLETIRDSCNPAEAPQRMVLDGEHRCKAGKVDRKIANSVKNYLPVTGAKAEDVRHMAGITIRHNKARGEHTITKMVRLLGELAQKGWTAQEIGKELGMGPDEVLKLLQNTGMPALFADQAYSRAWE